MIQIELAVFAISAILVLIALNAPVGLALGAVSLFGIAHIVGWHAALNMLGGLPFEFGAQWNMSAIPMFLLMGTIAYHSGMTASLFRAARLWLSFLPGGLAISTNFACAGYAAASGSSLATAVSMGRIAIPEMRRYNYDPGLATGVCACAGTLGSLIPPSVLLVLYGIFAEVSISQLFIAGIVPGLLTAFCYAVLIAVRCTINPDLAPPIEEHVTWGERFRVLLEIWPLPVIIVFVMGGIYLGFSTPTEAGAIGAFSAFVIAFVQRRLSFEVIRNSVLDALESSATIFFVAVGAVLLTKFMALCGLPMYMTELMSDWALDPLLLVIGASLIYIVLGMFLDPLGLMLLTLPVLLPMFEALDLNLVWFGIIVTKYIEIGLMTPPVGMNVYAVKSVVEDIPLDTIFRGALWFLLAEVVVMTILIAFPEVTLFLPRMMR